MIGANRGKPHELGRKEDGCEGLRSPERLVG